MNSLALITLLLWVLAAPIFAGAQTTQLPSTQTGTLSADGIFSCNGGGLYANAGTLAAVGGVYVPVNDAAVTINTGYLVWKECVLDGVNRKIAEAASTQLGGSILRAVTTGRNGKPLYEVNNRDESEAVADKTVLVVLSEKNLAPMSKAFEEDNRKILARYYLNQRNNPNNVFASNFPGTAEEQRQALKGNVSEDNVLKYLQAFSLPGEDPYSAFLLAREQMQAAIADALYQREKQLDRGNGFYPTTDNNDNPFAEKILTPAYLVSQGVSQVTSSGFRCLENANEINEMCNSLWAGLSTQLINDTRGLTGITQSQNNLPSYVSRMVSEASGAVRQQATNTALAILSNARQIEALYYQAQQQISNTLIGAINKLRGAENACWTQLIPKVQDYATTQSAQIKVATSTQFSQAVITAQIAPIATIAAQNVQKSQQSLALLDQLIQDVSNSSSATNQKQALERLDSMVANRQLHGQSDLQAATKQRDDVAAAATTLTDDTIKTWAGGDANAPWDGSITPGLGWCNYQNQDTIIAWFNKWRK